MSSAGKKGEIRGRDYSDEVANVRMCLYGEQQSIKHRPIIPFVVGASRKNKCSWTLQQHA